MVTLVGAKRIKDGEGFQNYDAPYYDVPWLSQEEVDQLLEGVTAEPTKEPDMPHSIHLKERRAKALMTRHIMAELRSSKTHLWVKPVLLVTAFCLLVLKL